MRFVGRCLTLQRLGLFVGTLALAGCVVAPDAYDNPLDDHYLYGYGQYGYRQYGYGQYGYGPYAAPPPGYYWWYPRQYGPSGYPPPFYFMRDDRYDRWHDRARDRPPEGDHGRHGRDRDRDGGTVVPAPGRVPGPVPRSGERRTAPQVVPDDGEQPAPIRRRGGSRPQDPPQE